MFLVRAIVKKEGNKWIILSKTGKKLGSFNTKKEALQRLKEIEHFKKQKGNYVDLPEIYIPNKGFLKHSLSIATKILNPNEINKETKDKLVKANKIDKPNDDLLYLELVLCHEGANANKDGFLIDELRENFETIKLKDLNIEHSDKIVGCIYDSVLIENEADATFTFAGGFKPHIVCSGVVYQFKFPDEAQEIRDRHEEGNLTFSMETWFKHVECSECNNTFKSQSTYCDHLSNRFSSGNNTIRWLKEITFGGVAVVKNPADKGAVSLTVAVRNLDDWDAGFIAEGIGESMENLERVLFALFKMFEENEIIDMNVVKNRFSEISKKLIDDKSDANFSKGGLNRVYKSFETKEDLLKDSDIQELVNTAVDTRLEKQDKEGKIKELQDKITSQEEGFNSNLEESNKKAEKVQSEFEEYKKEVEDEKKETELDELVKSRYDELTEDGVEYAEERVDKVKVRLRKMDDEEFVEYKEDMVANLSDKGKILADKKKKGINMSSDYSTANISTDNFEWEDSLDIALGGFNGKYEEEKQ